MPITVATKEFVLNYAMNRWGLNKKASVGPTSKSIRECKPSNPQEWNDYYFKNIRSRDHIKKLGEKLYHEIKNTIAYEKRFHPELVESITLQDCLDYMHDIVITRTYNGYKREFG